MKKTIILIAGLVLANSANAGLMNIPAGPGSNAAKEGQCFTTTDQINVTEYFGNVGQQIFAPATATPRIVCNGPLRKTESETKREYIVKVPACSTNRYSNHKFAITTRNDMMPGYDKKGLKMEVEPWHVQWRVEGSNVWTDLPDLHIPVSAQTSQKYSLLTSRGDKAVEYRFFKVGYVGNGFTTGIGTSTVVDELMFDIDTATGKEVLLSCTKGSNTGGPLTPPKPPVVPQPPTTPQPSASLDGHVNTNGNGGAGGIGYWFIIGILGLAFWRGIRAKNPTDLVIAGTVVALMGLLGTGFNAHAAEVEPYLSLGGGVGITRPTTQGVTTAREKTQYTPAAEVAVGLSINDRVDVEGYYQYIGKHSMRSGPEIDYTNAGVRARVWLGDVGVGGGYGKSMISSKGGSDPVIEHDKGKNIPGSIGVRFGGIHVEGTRFAGDHGSLMVKYRWQHRKPERVTVALPPVDPCSECRVEITPEERKVVEFRYDGDMVHFAYDKFELSEAAKARLRDAYEIIQKHALTITVIGSASRPGSVQYNFELSARRANAVGKYLESLGLDSGRIYYTALGEQGPEHPASEWAKWQYAEIRIND